MEDDPRGAGSPDPPSEGHGGPGPEGRSATHGTGGVTVADDGIRLEPAETRVPPGVEVEWTFRVLDGAGAVVMDFEAIHDRLGHLVLVRRDLTRFRHLHPRMAADGRWSTTFALPDPGVYRAFVDVSPGGRQTTLGHDLFASGAADYGPPPGSTREDHVDGYRIVMSPAAVPVGDPVTLGFAVDRAGEAARLDPYLGARGHLVALRAGDLAYLHVHPVTAEPEDGAVRFAARFPTAGRYRLFLQVKPDGTLLTASFDVRID